MQQNLAMKISEYLPEINAGEINFDEKNTQPYEEDLKTFSQSIQTWSHTVLEKAKLPIAAHEANALVNKYGLDKDEGCALRMVIELEAIQKSLNNQDASTVALASMKLMESVWYSSIFKVEKQPSSPAAANQTPAPAPSSSTPSQTEDKQKRQLYQETIDDLKGKYPHCNINALRLLAATRLNIGKQELDDLDISPQ